MNTTEAPESHEPAPLFGLGSSEVLGPAVEQALYSLIATADDESDDGNRDRAKLLHACATTLGAAIPRWRGMDSAPRDGTPVDLWHRQGFRLPEQWWIAEDACWVPDVRGDEDFVGWMAMPAGPND